MFPDCTAPESSTTCTLAAGGMHTPADATNMASGACVDILPNTTTTGWGATTQMGPCYTSDIGDLTVTLSGIPIILHQTVAGAEYSGTPASQLLHGLIRGFLTEADADATTIPSSLAVVGGMNLSALLPGGSGCCQGSSASGHEMDTLPDGTTGWWMYIEFQASPVPYTEL